MSVEVWVAVLALIGAVAGGLLTGPLQARLTANRADKARREERRWTLEFDSLVELTNVVSQLARPTAEHGAGEREAMKVRAVALAFRVRDDRPRRAVEPLVASPDGSQAWQDQIGNVVRIVGEVIRDL